MVFLTSRSDAFFKSGLAKSVFRDAIYENMPLDYYIPSIAEVQKLTMALSKKRLYAKFYQAHDAYLMFYKPYNLVLSSLKKQNKAAPVWHHIVSTAVKSEKFYDLNKVTANSNELSILAATRFLLSLLRQIDVEEYQKQFKQLFQTQLQQQYQQQTLAGQPALQQVVDVLNKAAENAVQDALSAVVEFKESKELAEEAIGVLAGCGGHSFTKDALSVWRFLEKPDDFRKRVSIVRYARLFFSQFLSLTPTSLQHQQVVSVYGGVNGITRMFSEMQLPDVLPSELAVSALGDAGRLLFAIKLAQKQLAVYQKAATIRPVIFVDKSGSMAETFEWVKQGGSEWVPKISVAAGLALALYKKLSADVYLFDTEVEKVNQAKVVETLLKIEADGGTNIDPVLEEITRIGKKEYLYIIISDGITEASQEVLEKFKASGLAKRTKLILVPPASERYNWVQLLKQYSNVYYARDVVDFTTAARKALE
jgi:Uncharacterized protein containing a von Willebrand factor type A (vWA) domain